MHAFRSGKGRFSSVVFVLIEALLRVRNGLMGWVWGRLRFGKEIDVYGWGGASTEKGGGDVIKKGKAGARIVAD